MTQTASPDSARDARNPSPQFVRNVRLGLVGFVIVVLLLIFAVPRIAPPPRTLANPDEAFIDRAGIVKPEFAREWAGALLNDDRAQIVVYIDRKAPAGDIAYWAIETASDWKIGAGKEDTGLVLFVFTEPRVARLDVGYGLEGLMTDARSRQLLEAHLAPAFAAKNYEKGFDDLIRAIRKEIGGYDADSIIARAQASYRSEVSWTTELGIAIKRTPRFLVSVVRAYLEEEASARLAILFMVSVGLAVAAVGVVMLCKAVLRVVTLPATIRAHPGDRVAIAAAAFEIGMGAVTFFICLSLVALVILAGQSLLGREGRFSGAGAMIVWPEAPR
jgi:uncharacterized membrane protein YgcG